MKTQFASFDSTRFESDLISKIVDRILPLARKHGVDYDRMEAEMDITACHCNGTPLDLNKLLNAPDFDFSHDVFGIRKHINWTTGEIEGFFSPRCSLKA